MNRNSRAKSNKGRQSRSHNQPLRGLKNRKARTKSHNKKQTMKDRSRSKMSKRQRRLVAEVAAEETHKEVVQGEEWREAKQHLGGEGIEEEAAILMESREEVVVP